MKSALETIVQGSEPFKVTSTKMLYDAPPVQFLIDTILPTHAICGLTGFPGTGKTWLAMEMARAVATGTNFLGHFPARQAPVLFIGSDASLLDYARQWWRLTHEAYESFTQEVENEDGTSGTVEVENPFNSYAHFMIQSDFNLDDIAMIAKLIRTSELVERPSYLEDVLTEDGWEQIEQEGHHYGLIVYDTLTKMTRTPENDNVGRDTVFEHLRDIAEATGATLLVLHHPTLVSEFRTGEEWRGAGSQFGALDTHYHIVRDNGRQDVIQFKVKKFRGITPKPFIFHLNVFDNENEALLSYEEELKDVATYDLELLTKLQVVLTKRSNAPTSIADFAIAIMQDPEINEAFKGDVTKVKGRIAHFLKRQITKPNSPIVRIVPGAGRRSGLYKLALQETTSDETASD